MFDLLEKAVQPLQLNTKVLEVAYDLYLQAPQSSSPVINLRELSRRTGESLLSCRNAIITAHELGRFPSCSLAS